MKQIVIAIEPEFGRVEVKAEGFKGQGCTAATKPCLDAIGQVVSGRKLPDCNQIEVGPTTQPALGCQR